MFDPQTVELPSGVEVFAEVGHYRREARTIWRVRVHGQLSQVRYWTREVAVASVLKH